jgi:hypothetical protein
MVGIRMFVDEGLGHSSYLIDLGDGTAAILDPPRFPTEHLATAEPRAPRRGGRSTRTRTPTTSPAARPSLPKRA